MNTTIIVSLLLVIITTALLLIVQRTSTNVIPGQKISNRDPTFIIAGPPNSGKTSLFTLVCRFQLIYSGVSTTGY